MTKGYLLDTHALLWAVYAPEKLGHKVSQIISASNRVFVSAVSAYEICYKYNRGKLDEAASLAQAFTEQIAVPGYALLDLTASHAQFAGLLPVEHKDPFDRLLIAQAQIEQLTLISNETLFDSMAVIRLW
jgi:PIN domain nuclease of toxin-antitoxin system